MSHLRVAVVADSHFDLGSRFEECVEVHRWISEDIRGRQVDLVVHSGDVYERASRPEERSAVAEWAQAVTTNAPLVVVRGNHDAVGDLALLRRLRTNFDLIVEEAAGVHRVPTRRGPVSVACLAWPRKAHLAALVGDGDLERADGDALRAALRGMGHEMERFEGPRILLAHAMVRGSVTSTGQPLVGCDHELGLGDLGLADADLYALGHIHRGQEFSMGEAPCIYPGSPRRTAFGELEEKGYIVAEFEEGESGRWRCMSHELVRTPCRPMLQLEGEFHGEHVGLPGDVVVPAGIALSGLPDDPADLRGAEVRVRYLVEADRRDEAREYAARARADLLERGAHSVKVEEQVVATTRARAPEVGRAQTLPEQLEAFWVAKGIDIDTERRARLLGRVAGLEGSR